MAVPLVTMAILIAAIASAVFVYRLRQTRREKRREARMARHAEEARLWNETIGRRHGHAPVGDPASHRHVPR